MCSSGDIDRDSGVSRVVVMMKINVFLSGAIGAVLLALSGVY